MRCFARWSSPSPVSRTLSRTCSRSPLACTLTSPPGLHASIAFFTKLNRIVNTCARDARTNSAGSIDDSSVTRASRAVSVSSCKSSPANSLSSIQPLSSSCASPRATISMLRAACSALRAAP
jgi:hypothetical protein